MSDKDPVYPAETPFGPTKTAEQIVQLAIDPSFGLTRKRYGWFSNGTLFDESLLSDVEAGIRLETTATGSDEVRLRTAYAGQYISQALAQPGMGYVFDPDVINIDSNGYVSLTHGEAYFGGFWWDSSNNYPDTGLGYHYDTNGLEFFAKSLGSHIGDSPWNQDEWSRDPYNGSGKSGNTHKPDNGQVINWPYTWYNEGPFGGAELDKELNQIKEQVRKKVDGRASFDTPNVPIQTVVRNGGTATSMGVEIGGMQFTTYGAGREEIQRRPTDESRTTGSSGYISNQRATTDNAIDPSGEPGKPLVSFQRSDGNEDLELRSNYIRCAAVSDDIYIYAWDEWEPNTALTGQNFDDPTTPNNAGKETKILTDTVATDYSPSTAVFRGMKPFNSGTNNVDKADLTKSDIDVRTPIGAARVYTAVNKNGTNADASPFIVGIEEGY